MQGPRFVEPGQNASKSTSGRGWPRVHDGMRSEAGRREARPVRPSYACQEVEGLFTGRFHPEGERPHSQCDQWGEILRRGGEILAPRGWDLRNTALRMRS